MQAGQTDFKYWVKEYLYFGGEICYTVGEWLAAVGYFVLLVFNLLSRNLHNESIEDERQRLYEEQRRQRLWEEEERKQRDFEERQRRYSLHSGEHVDQMQFESGRRRQRLATLHSEAEHIRRKQRTSSDDDLYVLSRQMRDLEDQIASLERIDKQAHLELFRASDCQTR